MSDLNSIVLAIELATSQRDELAKAVAKAQRASVFSRDQMAQLQGYAGETDARWTGTTGRVLSAELLRHHYQFMARLQQAIALQTDAMANAGFQLEQANKALLQAEYRLAGLKQVLATRKAALAQMQKRREQRVTDEFAGMLHARNRARSMTGEVL